MPFDNNLNYISTRTIEQAWQDALWCCIRNGYDYRIEHGSYVYQIRRQLDHLAIKITEPWTRPLAPRMPEGSVIPAPTNSERIEHYFTDYLISKEKEETEDYTYGMYISKQMSRVIDILNQSNGNSNQATITIGDIESVNLESPPCLRVIDFKVVDHKLNMSTFWRSWDLFAGLPENLGGLQLLKEYTLMHLNNVQDGNIFAYSSGAHIYEMYFPIVNQLNVDKIEI